MRLHTSNRLKTAPAFLFGGVRLRSKTTESAFNLVELLVVVLILSTLGGILLPVFSCGMAAAKRIHCINNQRQLGVTWMLYSFDNEERLVANGENSPPSTTNLEWIQGGFVHAQYSIETKYVSDPKYALFAKYIPNARTYLCPSDPPNITLDEYSYARVRSYELNCYVGWEGDWDFRLPGDFKVFRKQQQISPTPSEIFLFQDVNPKSICWPHFGVRMDESSFFNFPSSAHSRGGIISYCDGHVAYHRWEDQRTVTAFAGSYHAHHQPSPGNPDLAWLRNHTTVPKQ